MNYDEKAVVKIDADGGVVKCAKGLGGEECGYKADATVCGKCGAMAVEVKMVPVNMMSTGETDDEAEPTDEEMKMMMRLRKEMYGDMPLSEDDEEEMKMMMRLRKGMYGSMMEEEELPTEDELKMMMRRRKAMDMANGFSSDMADEETAGLPELEDDEESMGQMDSEKGYGMGMPKKKAMKPTAASMSEDEDMDEEDMEDEEMTEVEMEDMETEDMEPEDEEDEDEEVLDIGTPMRPTKGGMYMGPGEDDDDMMSPDLEAMRMARLRKLGTKSADIGVNGYMCAIERKVYPGGQQICGDCPGGCMAEKGMPGLLHVEGLAEAMFKGADVIDSGYSAVADMFVVDVQVKSGHVNEVYVDGTTGEVLGFHRLDDSAFEQKSILDDIELIDFNEAAEIAVKSLPGTVVAVEPSIFEGHDAYQVEIDGFDGKAYDAYVSLDGHVLGYDEYLSSDETDDIEAEAAEIALKRAFSEESRNRMAEEGTALPDGSFPIASEDDLKNAIMAHGRAKDIEAAKRHIMKRAKEMGAEAMIPAEWLAGKKNLVAEGDAEGTDDFLKTLVEFELMSAEVDLDS